MQGNPPEVYPNTPPDQYCRQVLRARGQCTVLSPDRSKEVRTFELPAAGDADEYGVELLPFGGKLLPAPRS